MADTPKSEATLVKKYGTLQMFLRLPVLDLQTISLNLHTFFFSKWMRKRKN